jgi:drug/metabolite transporter (DMT)-like permease
MKNNALYGKMALFTAAFLWGISFVAVEKAMEFGWTPFVLLGMRGLLSGVALSGFALKKKFWKNRLLILESILAGFILFIGMAFQTYGQQLSTVSNSSFITVLYVVFIPVILWKRQKATKSVLLAIFFAVIGTAFLTLNGALTVNVGDILLIGCAWLFAFHIIFLNHVIRHDDVIPVAMIQSLTMGVLGFIFAGFNGQGIPTIGWIYVLYAGIISSGLALFLQLYGQQRVSPTISGLLLTLESLFGSLGAIFLLNEPFTLNVLVGGSLMLLAVVTIELGPRLFLQIKGG